MKRYLNRIIKHCAESALFCQNIIEDVNDGSERSPLVISSCEVYYSCCDMLRVYYRTYPSEFSEDKIRRLRKIMSYSPEKQIMLKRTSRDGLSPEEIDDLPF